MATDDLIEALCADGRVDSHGGFTLDSDQAREKLRTFQVAEPHRYALHLVALAVLRGATAIAFTIDSDDLWARFDGAPLAAADFEDLYGSSFAAATTADERARQQLALALNAALALNPRHVRVTSGPPGARVRLEVRHGAPDAVSAVDEQVTHTEIHVKQRFRPGLAVRFIKNVLGDMPEETCLEERCGYAPIPITINGRKLAGTTIEAGLQHVREVADDEGRTCVAGLREFPSARPEVRVVRHGVWITTLAMPYLPGGTLAVICDEHLQTDLSGQEIVEGEGRERCLALVERAVEATTVALIDERATVSLDPWLRTRLRPAWREWPRARVAEAPLGDAIAALPWFTDIFGRPRSLTELRAERARTGGVYYTTTEFAGRLERFSDLVVALPPRSADEPCEDLLLLRALFGADLRDRTRDLEHAVRRAARERLWRARPAEPVLDEARYTALAPIHLDLGARAIEGQVGLRSVGGPDLGARASVRVIADGHLLCELDLELPLPVDAVLAGLEPDHDIEGPRRDETFALAALAVLDAALGLVEENLSPRPASAMSGAALVLARRFLELRYDPDQPLRWLERFAVRDAAARAALASPVVAALPRICRAREGAPLDRLREPWLADSVCLQTCGRETISLGALALALTRGEPVAVTGDDAPPMPGLERIILRLDPRARTLVTTVFADRISELSADGLAHGTTLDRPAVLLDEAEEDLLIRLHGERALERIKVDERRAPGRSGAVVHHDILAAAFVTGSDVAGKLWLTADDPEDARVVIEVGQGSRKVKLLPPLPLAGTLHGSGVRHERGKVMFSDAAQPVVHDAALRLYDALLACRDPPAGPLLERIAAHLGDKALPAPLDRIVARIHARLSGNAPLEPDLGAPVEDTHSRLAQMFAELEASAHTAPPTSVDAPSPKPPSSRPADPPTPEARLLAALRSELHTLRESHEQLLSGFNLDHVRLATSVSESGPVAIGASAVVLSQAHPMIQRLTATVSHDPVALDILASLVFTALNIWRQEITDEDEALFHRLHLARIVRRLNL